MTDHNNEVNEYRNRMGRDPQLRRLLDGLSDEQVERVMGEEARSTRGMHVFLTVDDMPPVPFLVLMKTGDGEGGEFCDFHVHDAFSRISSGLAATDEEAREAVRRDASDLIGELIGDCTTMLGTVNDLEEDPERAGLVARLATLVATRQWGEARQTWGELEGSFPND